jgi:tetratricopeptide (TPR) repeat protein
LNRSIALRRISVLAAAAAAALILTSGFPRAGESEDFRFAQRLRRDKMFVSAAEEFLRFAGQYPSSALRPAALFEAGESWMEAGRAKEALDTFERMLADYPADQNACTARYYRGTILKALKQYREAAAELLLVPEQTAACPVEGRALLEAGECLIAAGDPLEAAGVLRPLWQDGRFPDQAPRAGYSLAVALADAGRDLEADGILAEIVSKHPSSPVAALALMRLGDRAMESRRYADARDFYRRAVEGYREDSLRERAIRKLIDASAAAGDDRAVLDRAQEYLRSFPDAPHRGTVYRAGIDAARRLGDTERVLSLISSWRSEEAYADSTGEVSLIRAGVLAERGNRDKALAELSGFRRAWPSSPLLVEALLLEGRLLEEAGRAQDAALRYSVALLEGADGEDRLSALGRLADLSIASLADTSGAVRLWETIAAEDAGSEEAEEALWRAAAARAAAGDYAGAAGTYRRIEIEYPASPRRDEAAESAERAELLTVPEGDAAGDLARLAVDETVTPGMRRLEAGRILLQKERRPDEAASYLRAALDSQIPDDQRPRARYLLGAALAMEHDLSAARGTADGGSLDRALDEWFAVAREAPGTEFGGKAHRAWLERRLPRWKTSEQLGRLDEFLAIYRADYDHYWWAVGRQLDVLYDAAPGEGGWAADSALAVAGRIISNQAPAPLRREALLRSGYLRRMRADDAGAARDFALFAERYADDRRTGAVLFDLGETRFSAAEYRPALDAYRGCLAAGAPPGLDARCRLRIGDCRYYLREYTAAAEEYEAVAAHNPRTGLEDDAAYRRALALRMAGEAGRSDSILVALYGRNDLQPGVRARVIGLLGRRSLERGDPAEAVRLFEELVAIERSHQNLTVLGEGLLALGRADQARKEFDEALKLAGADTCRILAGRSRAWFDAGDEKKGQRDLDRLLEACPGHQGAAEAMLSRGKAATAAGRCDEAAQVLAWVRETYPGSTAASEALYQMAICDLRRGGYQQAIDRLGQCLREAPDSPLKDQVYFKLATAHYAAGDRNLAAANYALAAEASADPERAFAALANLARIYQEIEEWERAAAVWQQVSERFPEREDIVETLFNLGFCYGQSGRPELAWEVYSRIPSVAVTEEQKGRAHYWAGISLKNLDRCDEAIREFLRVPYLRTGGMWGVTSKLEAAACYERLGRLDEAKEIYRQIIASSGEGSDWGALARKSLDRLEAGQQQEPGGGERRPNGS